MYYTIYTICIYVRIYTLIIIIYSKLNILFSPNSGHLSIADSIDGPVNVLYLEVLLYILRHTFSRFCLKNHGYTTYTLIRLARRPKTFSVFALTLLWHYRAGVGGKGKWPKRPGRRDQKKIKKHSYWQRINGKILFIGMYDV